MTLQTIPVVSYFDPLSIREEPARSATRSEPTFRSTRSATAAIALATNQPMTKIARKRA